MPPELRIARFLFAFGQKRERAIYFSGSVCTLLWHMIKNKNSPLDKKIIVKLENPDRESERERRLFFINTWMQMSVCSIQLPHAFIVDMGPRNT